MTVHSAGLALFRHTSTGSLEVLLAHMGGPFWAKKDDGAWTFPKGEFEPSTEAPLDAAQREFAEELGFAPPSALGTGVPPPVDLGEVSSSGKRIRMYAYEVDGTFALDNFAPGTFELEWPPRSGRRQAFPEVDRIDWVPLADAAAKLTKAQGAFVARLGALADRP